jgi:hypothetical protein
MDSTEFISFGGKVVAFGPAGARSAISRSYYGAFHFARNVLRELGVRVPGSGSSHVFVTNYLQAPAHSDAQNAGALISHLHSYRVKADYDLDDAPSELISFAQGCVVSAQAAVKLLTQYRDACLANQAIRQELLDAAAELDAVRKPR